MPEDKMKTASPMCDVRVRDCMVVMLLQPTNGPVTLSPPPTEGHMQCTAVNVIGMPIASS